MTAILVVEDDALTRKNICQLLDDEGYEIGQAGDGIEALELLNSRTFDLVLSDIVMPRMDGLTLIQHIRATWPRTYIMVITAHFQRNSRLGFSVAGADEFIRKPFILEDLLFKIKCVLQSESSNRVKISPSRKT